MLGKGLESLIPKKDVDVQDAAIPPLVDTRDLRHTADERTNESSPDKNIAASSPRRAEEKSGPVFYIETEKVSTNPYQPRRHFDESTLADLASSIREVGIIQPLIVSKRERQTETGADVEYQLIAGERRLRAARMAGLSQVPVIVRNIPVAKEGLEIAIIENLQREDLNPIDAARSFARLQDEFGLAQREIAARIGRSRETISNAVRLLSLPSYIQDAVEQGGINESQARLLLGVEDIARQKKLFDSLASGGMSVRRLRDAIRNHQRAAKSAPENNRAKDPHIALAEERLQEFFGAPVNVRQTTQGGRVVISFYSDEELQGLLERLGGDTGL